MTTTTSWKRRPNARHIAAILADVNARPAVARQVEWTSEWVVADDVVNGVLQGTAWVRAVRILEDTKRRANTDAAFGVLRGEARYAVCALIAWDSSADLLDLSPDALRTLIDVAPAPVCHQAALLLPWAIVREQQP